MPDGSVYCNRCGAKMRTQEERLGKPKITVPPPRPARRHPTIERRPVSKPVESSEGLYDDQVYNRRGPTQQYDRQTNRRGNQRADVRDEQGDEVEGPEYNQQGERIIFRINPTFYPVAVAYLTSIVCSLLVAAIVAYLQGSFWIVLGFAIVFFIPSFIRHIKLINTVYILTAAKVEIVTGFFSKTRRNIPVPHIQDVFVSETFHERIIGIGDIIIETAASGSRTMLENIHEPGKYADMILDQLRKVR